MKTSAVLVLLIAFAFAFNGQEKPADEISQLKNKLASAELREKVLLARERGNSTLAEINRMKVQVQEQVEELQKRLQKEFGEYSNLLGQMQKTCKAEETLDEKTLRCQSNPTPKKTEERKP